LDLSQRFYEQAVRPVLSSSFPALGYSAASIGQGSDVLGFDTSQSMDQFTDSTDVLRHLARIKAVF
jgi:hypothetical protein